MQTAIGVPEAHHGRHGWHTYEITGYGLNQTLTELHTRLWIFLSESPVFRYYKRTENEATPGNAQISCISKEGDVAFELKYTNVSNPFVGGQLQQLKVSQMINGGAVYAKGALDILRSMRREIGEG
jgi:hypothetical protein